MVANNHPRDTKVGQKGIPLVNAPSQRDPQERTPPKESRGKKCLAKNGIAAVNSKDPAPSHGCCAHSNHGSVPIQTQPISASKLVILLSISFFGSVVTRAPNQRKPSPFSVVEGVSLGYSQHRGVPCPGAAIVTYKYVQI